MLTQFQTITPKMAAEWLSKNHSNRSVSKQVIRQYASDMSNGKWLRSHQGILIGKNGNLIDGQHRLSAVVAAGVDVEMLVCIDESFESALMSNIDIGRKRLASVSLGINSHDSAVCALLLRVCKGINSPSPSEISAVYQLISPFTDKLTNTATRGISTAVRLAAIYRMWESPVNEGWVRTTYHAMTSSLDCKNLDPLPWSLYQQLVVDRVQYHTHETLARSMKAFDYSQRGVSRLQFKDIPAAISDASSKLKSMLQHLTEK